MATLGNVPAEAYTNTVKDSFSGNGSTTAFTMSLPTVTNDVRVVVENVIQDPTVAYSVSGTTLTFTSAPPSGTNNIYVVHLGPAVMTTVPPAEIADATTFASSLTVQGAFTSKGIDDNADAVALTIDSSENVLVGKASSSTTTAGNELRAGGLAAFTRSGSYSLNLNRLASDGDIAVFQKDGTTVGSIGAHSSGTYLGTADTGIYFNGGNDSIDPYNPSVPINRDNAISLGAGSRRFKDLYLSGGVYLGGTGAANKLEDYEEGTWEPTIIGTSSSPTVTYQADNGGSYTKIGRVVYYTGCVRWTAFSGGSGTARIGNLPFTSAARTNGDNADSVGSARTSIWNGTSSNHPTVIGMVANNTTLNIVATSSTGTAATLQISDLGTNCSFQFTCIAYV